MPLFNPVKEDVKLPIPVPSVVFEFAMVGLGLVLQQTPLAIMGVPPSEPISPPDVAVVKNTFETAVVEMVDMLATVTTTNTLF